MAGDVQRKNFYRGRRLHDDKRRANLYMPVAPDDGKLYGGSDNEWFEITGVPGTGQSYEHVQATAAKVWDISHGLGDKHPRVILLDEDGKEFFAYLDREHATVNFIRVVMALPTAGKAIVTAG